MRHGLELDDRRTFSGNGSRDRNGARQGRSRCRDGASRPLRVRTSHGGPSHLSVTNTMGLTGDDFEKGESDGTTDALAVIGAIITALK